MANSKNGVSRGKIEKVNLKRSLILNSLEIRQAVIEIDHINFGLNKKTKALNARRRTTFSVADIERFLMLLDGEQIAARGYKGKISQFEVRVDCPIRGRFYGKEFIMIFDLNYDEPELIYTITLYPGW